MNAKELFTVGMKLIGVYALVEGVTSLPSLLRLVDFPSNWDVSRSTLAYILIVALQLAVGWYLIRGAPWLMNAAGFGSPGANG